MLIPLKLLRRQRCKSAYVALHILVLTMAASRFKLTDWLGKVGMKGANIDLRLQASGLIVEDPEVEGRHIVVV